MQYYNDRSNEAAANLFFMFFQMVMLLIVYGFVYTALIGVKLAIAKYDLPVMTYFPELTGVILYPVVLHRTRRMFKAGKRLRAVAWCIAWASVIIVLLYVHLDKLVVG